MTQVNIQLATVLQNDNFFFKIGAKSCLMEALIRSRRVTLGILSRKKSLTDNIPFHLLA